MIKENGIHIIFASLGIVFFACSAEQDSSTKSKSKSSEIKCNFIVAGKSVQGRGKKECDKLAKASDAKLSGGNDSPPDREIQCKYKIKGKIKKGYSMHECHLLSLKYQEANAMVLPIDNSNVHESVSCSYIIDGMLQNGHSQDECDELKTESL